MRLLTLLSRLVMSVITWGTVAARAVAPRRRRDLKETIFDVGIRLRMEIEGFIWFLNWGGFGLSVRKMMYLYTLYANLTC